MPNRQRHREPAGEQFPVLEQVPVTVKPPPAVTLLTPTWLYFSESTLTRHRKEKLNIPSKLYSGQNNYSKAPKRATGALVNQLAFNLAIVPTKNPCFGGATQRLHAIKRKKNNRILPRSTIFRFCHTYYGL